MRHFARDCRFAALVCSDNACANAELFHEGREILRGGSLDFVRKAHTHREALLTIKVHGVALIRSDDAIGRIVGAFVVVGQGGHESKVHEELGATCGDTFSNTLGCLFRNICLLFEVHQAKWVIFKHHWHANDMTRKGVKLALAW